MNYEHIPLARLSISKTNMRHGKKAPDVSRILPSVRKRGVIIPLIVRPNCNPDHFEIMAGRRRYFAALAVEAEGQEGVTVPCAILHVGQAVSNVCRVESGWRAPPRVRRTSLSFDLVSI